MPQSGQRHFLGDSETENTEAPLCFYFYFREIEQAAIIRERVIKLTKIGAYLDHFALILAFSGCTSCDCFSASCFHN